MRTVLLLAAILTATACGGGGGETPDAGEPLVLDGGRYTVPGCGFDVVTRVGAEAPAPGDAHVGAEPAPRQIRLGFAGDPKESIAVVWRTDVDTTTSTMKFGVGAALDQTAEGVTYRYPSGLDGNGDIVRLHEVHLCGLTPDTEYSYQVGAEGAFSETFTFRTAPDVAANPDTHVVIAFVGDSRNGNAVWETIADQIVTHAPDLVVYTGDVVTLGVVQEEWDEFFDAADTLMATAPMMSAHGNHETNAIEYYTAFALPGDEENFSYDYGHVHQTIMNTDPAVTDDITGDSADFLDADLTAATSVWKIVSFHRGMWSSSTNHGSDTTLRDAWGPIIDSHGVDLVIAGHDHIFERTKPLTGDVPGTGTIHIVSGGAGATLYDIISPLPAYSEFAESTYNFTILDIGQTMLSSTTYRDDGSVLDQFALSK